MLFQSRQESQQEIHLVARCEVAHLGQLHFVDMHEQLNGPFPDLQSWHVGQEVIAHKEAHEHCSEHSNCHDAEDVCTLCSRPVRITNNEAAWKKGLLAYAS